MELRNISDKVMDDFVETSDKSHFMQTSAWGDVSKNRGYIIHQLGLYNNEQLLGTALLLEKKVLMYSTFYCPRGFILDFKNKELIKEMLKQLKDYCYKHNGLYLKINPDLIIAKLDDECNRKETDEGNFELIEFFKENGGSFRGFTTTFSESSAPRFTFRVNVERSEEEIFNGLHNTTRKILKDKNPYKVSITKNDPNALEDFYQVMKETSIRKKMYIEPYTYFENFYKELANKDEADIYVASINTNELKEIFNNKLANVDKEIEDVNKRPDGPKKENKLKDLDQKRNKVLKLKKEVDELKKERIVLSSIITARFGDKVWTIHGGNSDELLFLNANYELYYHILLDSKANGYKLVDFYGSEGKVDKSSQIYGIYLFKLRFGGDFDEFIGEFDFIYRPFMNSLITTLLKSRRKIKYLLSVKRK
ncbi:MAG: peptidoglycan bridge formation glycyltransferase FemA/FemB family protein [Erysipelotrichaceae bacterium]|nr:peptidoglycan bridge formation glycyltransferase FemA/FemB family protein [Erysipelotrichaceae bacterium]